MIILFDIKICLDKCNHYMIQQILSHHFQKEIDLAMISSIKENKITPLEVINSAIMKDNLEDTLIHLQSLN